VFPFARFPGVDTVLGPEMRSTGEVMGLDPALPWRSPSHSWAGAPRCRQTAPPSSQSRPRQGAHPAGGKTACVDLGFKIIATGGTQRYLTSKGVPAKKVNKVLEGRPHIVDAMTNGEVQLVFNTTEGQAALADSKSIRRAALMGKIPYYTTLAGALAAAQGIAAYKQGELQVRPLQDYF
jgi:carbamoyl-phosphate synthase large subunit